MHRRGQGVSRGAPLRRQHDVERHVAVDRQRERRVIHPDADIPSRRTSSGRPSRSQRSAKGVWSHAGCATLPSDLTAHRRGATSPRDEWPVSVSAKSASAPRRSVTRRIHVMPCPPCARTSRVVSPGCIVNATSAAGAAIDEAKVSGTCHDETSRPPGSAYRCSASVEPQGSAHCTSTQSGHHRHACRSSGMARPEASTSATARGAQPDGGARTLVPGPRNVRPSWKDDAGHAITA